MTATFYLVSVILTSLSPSSSTAVNFVNGHTFKARNFGKVVANVAINATILKTLTVSSELQCLTECVLHSLCISYNFKPPSTGKGFLCELSGTDRFSGRENMTSVAGCSHRGVKTACDRPSTCGDKGFCIPVYEDDAARCDCLPGYAGAPCNPKSCAQILKEGHVTSGVYTVNPDGQQSFPVYCDMVTDWGGWIVLQRRQDGSVSFNRGWNEYKNGFGDISGEFWLGNDKIHRLTTSQEMVLRFDLEDFEGNKTYAIYQDVNVLAESEKYLLSFGAYSGTAGDSLTSRSNGMYFTTIDRDNDRRSNDNCAVQFKGGWWYRACHHVNINGLYEGGPSLSFATGINWHLFRGLYYSLKKTEMKIRPNKSQNSSQSKTSKLLSRV